MDSVRSQLKDMGFTEAKVQRALSSCPEAATLEQVMEWLIAHEEELNAEASSTNPAAQRQEDAAAAAKQESAKEAADMAQKKSISLQEAERLIEERRVKRLEEEKKKAIEDEKARRISGQKMAETRAELEAAERIRIAQQIRQEKKEKELHKKMILDQIARDREARKARDTKDTNTEQTTKLLPSPGPSKPAAANSCANYSECKLALRFPDGTNVIQTFAAKEQLAAVRLFVQLKCNQSVDQSPGKHIEFYIPPNVKLAEDSMEKTLESLGLCPSSRVMVQFKSNVP